MTDKKANSRLLKMNKLHYYQIQEEGMVGSMEADKK